MSAQLSLEGEWTILGPYTIQSPLGLIHRGACVVILAPPLIGPQRLGEVVYAPPRQSYPSYFVTAATANCHLFGPIHT